MSDPIKIPLRGGEAIYMRPVDERCVVHDLEDDERIERIRVGMRIPGGINVCVDCLDRARDYLRHKLAEASKSS